MRNFTDEQGKSWGIRIDRSMLRAVQKSTSILLTDLALDDFALLKQICSDPLLAGDILWIVCQEQAAERSMSEQDFEKATDGDCFEGAVITLVEAVADFFPEPQRGLMHKMIASGKESYPQQVEMMKQLVDLENQDLTRKIQSRIDELTRSGSTSSSPESSESIPTPEHSGS